MNSRQQLNGFRSTPKSKPLSSAQQLENFNIDLSAYPAEACPLHESRVLGKAS